MENRPSCQLPPASTAATVPNHVFFPLCLPIPMLLSFLFGCLLCDFSQLHTSLLGPFSRALLGFSLLPGGSSSNTRRPFLSSLNLLFRLSNIPRTRSSLSSCSVVECQDGRRVLDGFRHAGISLKSTKWQLSTSPWHILLPHRWASHVNHSPAVCL